MTQLSTYKKMKVTEAENFSVATMVKVDGSSPDIEIHCSAPYAYQRAKVLFETGILPEIKQYDESEERCHRDPVELKLKSERQTGEKVSRPRKSSIDEEIRLKNKKSVMGGLYYPSIRSIKRRSSGKGLASY